MDEEKRFFKRYKDHIAFDAMIKGILLQSEIVDYSVDGVGLVVKEDSPHIATGEILDLHLKPFFDILGTVVWAKHEGNKTMVGLSTHGSISGLLTDYWLSDIFIGIQRMGKTGVLEIKSGDVLKKIYIKDGEMIFSFSNRNEDRLGNMLLLEGKITQPQFDESLEILKKTGKRHGKILVDLGYLTPHDLFLAVRRQVEMVIMSVFGLEEGHFEFNEGPLPSEEVITIYLPAAELIYKGIKRVENETFIRNMCPPLDTVLALAYHPIDLFQGIKFDEHDRFVLSLVDGKTSFKEIISKSHLTEGETLKTIFALLATRTIDVMGEGKHMPDVSVDEMVTESIFENTRELSDRIETIYSKHKSRDFHGVLGVNENATEQEIKKAYYRAAKDFHPDRHFTLQPDMKKELQTVFAYITNAYNILVDPDYRAGYAKLQRASEYTATGKDAARQKAEMGKNEFWNGEYAKAEKLFAEVVYLDSSNPKYQHFYSKILLKLGKFKEAENAIRVALMINKQNPDYIATEGLIFIGLGFVHRAKGRFEDALKIDPLNKIAVQGLQKITSG